MRTYRIAHTHVQERVMEATVAERGQITLPKAVRDALGLTKGTQLKVELDGGRIILRKNVDDAISRARGRFKLPPGVTTDDIMRELRGRAPGRPGRRLIAHDRRSTPRC
jgi:AbrB family looped-hinge helix DNA binding protein